MQTGILDPQGPIAVAERSILLNATATMLAIVIPVVLLTIGFAFWFRSGNLRARYMPDWAYSGRIELVVWSIPTLVIIFLGGIAWIGSHSLDPAKNLNSAAAPVDIQVVSLDWKWLFIYPEQRVASVNQLVVPAGVPIRFQLTSASVMNSFFIPQLGSQIYTMAGMTSRLNLLADKPGTYEGLSAHFSGNGFSDMHFPVMAMSKADFDAWIDRTRSVAAKLDRTAYKELQKPSTAVKPFTYGSIEEGLFETIVLTDEARDALAANNPRPAAMPPAQSSSVQSHSNQHQGH